MSTPIKRVIVVGGGISGLACARAIAESRSDNPRIEISLLESSQRFGGNVMTEREGDFVLDRGPDSWVTNKPEASELARALGLGDTFISTLPENRRVYIAHESALHPMPEGLVLGIPTRILPIARTPLFSVQAKARMALEPFVPVRHFHGDDDESIGAFVERRLGREVSERLVGPLLGGIFAGDAGSISVRAAFPQLVEAERKYGSLLRAVRSQKRANPNAAAFVSLRDGMGSFVDALVADLEKRDGVRLKRGTGVRSMARTEEGKLVLELDDGTNEVADAVVIATPVHVAAKIFRDLDQATAESIEGVMGTVSSATIFFGFEEASIGRPLDATGFIVPRTGGTELLASTWVSSKWQGRAPKGRVLIRGFLGGAGREATLEKTDDELSTLALFELRKLMPISKSPLFSRVFRFMHASPQPRVGHLARARQLREKLEAFPGVYVIGNGYDGVGIPACIKSATETARKITS